MNRKQIDVPDAILNAYPDEWAWMKEHGLVSGEAICVNQEILNRVSSWNYDALYGDNWHQTVNAMRWQLGMMVYVGYPNGDAEMICFGADGFGLHFDRQMVLRAKEGQN